jgi:hypothetical protein
MSLYREQEKRVLQAVDAFSHQKFPTIKAAAEHFNAPYNRVKYRLKGGNSRSTRQPTNRLLTDEEERGIITWMKEREDLGCRVSLPELKREAIRVRVARLNDLHLPKPSLPSEHWAPRFTKRLQLDTAIEKPKDAARNIAEDPVIINNWFHGLKGILADVGIENHPTNLWNYDEMGCIIGQGKRRKVIRFNTELPMTAGTLTSRVQVTMGETISAAGRFIPPIIIIPGEQHQQRWYTQSNLPGFYQLGVTPSGYTNDEIHLQYLDHFERYSSKTQTLKHRILFLDGHECHMTIDFINACSKNDILPIIFPPHLTHLMQPLDVKVFQPWKAHYKDAVNQAYMHGADTIDIVDFLNMLQRVRLRTLKAKTIQHAFEETGLYPLNAQKVLCHVRPETPPPATPTLQSSPISISETPMDPHRIRKYIAHFQDNENAAQILQKITTSTLALTTAYTCLKRDLQAHNAQKKKQLEARKNARRSLRGVGLLSLDQGRKMTHNLQEKAAQRAQNRSEAAKKAAVTRKARAAARKQALPQDTQPQIVQYMHTFS